MGGTRDFKVGVSTLRDSRSSFGGSRNLPNRPARLQRIFLGLKPQTPSPYLRSLVNYFFTKFLGRSLETERYLSFKQVDPKGSFHRRFPVNPTLYNYQLHYKLINTVCQAVVFTFKKMRGLSLLTNKKCGLLEKIQVFSQ